jgi:hypothetical protein
VIDEWTSSLLCIIHWNSGTVVPRRRRKLRGQIHWPCYILIRFHRIRSCLFGIFQTKSNLVSKVLNTNKIFMLNTEYGHRKCSRFQYPSNIENILLVYLHRTADVHPPDRKRTDKNKNIYFRKNPLQQTSINLTKRRTKPPPNATQRAFKSLYSR